MREEIIQEVQEGRKTDPDLAMLRYLFAHHPPTPLEFLRASPSERWILQGLLAAWMEDNQNVG